MHFVREIWLRHVKCAAAREGFISFHIERSEIFHNFRKKIISHSATPNISLKRIMVLFGSELIFLIKFHNKSAVYMIREQVGILGV